MEAQPERERARAREWQANEIYLYAHSGTTNRGEPTIEVHTMRIEVQEKKAAAAATQQQQQRQSYYKQCAPKI